MDNLVRFMQALVAVIGVPIADRRRIHIKTLHGVTSSQGNQVPRAANRLTPVLFVSLLSLALAAPGASALELITPTEAKLPDAVPRGITRSPTLRVVSPDPGAKQLGSPFSLKISFEPHGGATIDPSTVKVTYLKSPTVDLTQRLAPYISAAGIALNDAVAPPGQHSIRVEVRDSDQRVSNTIISLRVTK